MKSRFQILEHNMIIENIAPMRLVSGCFELVVQEEFEFFFGGSWKKIEY